MDFDSGSLADELDLVAGDLDELPEEELWLPKAGVGAKVGLGQDTGQRVAVTGTLRDLDEGGNGEGIFHEASLAG